MTNREQSADKLVKALEHVISKGMIVLTDHHDVEAWRALNSAVEDYKAWQQVAAIQEH